MQLLEGHGIQSYFSACLTLTLPKNERVLKQDYILCVDVSDELVEVLHKTTSKKIIVLVHSFLEIAFLIFNINIIWHLICLYIYNYENFGSSHVFFISFTVWIIWRCILTIEEDYRYIRVIR